MGPTPVAAGGSATFTVTATGVGPISYQWLKDGTAISGQTGAALTLNNVTAASAGSYSVAVSNSGGTTTSASATLTVTGGTVSPPAIVTQPISATVAAGGSATFTVTATGVGPISYQWLKDGTAISGQTGAALTLNNVTAASAGSYSVAVSNSGGTTTSASATLTVTGGTVSPPVISTQPVSA